MKNCPNCGSALEAFSDTTIGDLTIRGGGAEFEYQSKRIHFTPAESLILMAVTGANGATVKNSALADVIDNEGADPGATIKVLTCRIRRKFRSVDPEFSSLETQWGVGLRWRVG
jgi:two-component system response regulator ChvI